MAKINKISVNAFEKAVKDSHIETIEAEWNGLPVVITHTISMSDMIELVAEVADNCFMDDGKFMPEVMQALLDCGVIERYTNISLPSSLSVRYELVTKSNIMEFVMDKINTTQYNDIVVAVRDKIDYMCDANTVAFNHAVSSMSDMSESIQNCMSRMNELLGADDKRTIEQRIVDEYRKISAEQKDNVSEKWQLTKEQ